MTAESITLLIVVAICVAAGVLLLLGRGDWLISGYNTASAEERAEYNIRRLRLVMGIGMLAVGALVLLDLFVAYEAFLIVTILPVTILILVLGNTWAKN
ncbi:MAG: DUF3784 domain-containing protein [Tidjanibacter sp.]|nr:DUF3784 domain-containing protein [Tidjanibacter sp.]